MDGHDFQSVDEINDRLAKLTGSGRSSEMAQAWKKDDPKWRAERLMVSLLPAKPDNKLRLMREVVEKAERNFGEAFFEETLGHFRGTVSTRPYMRAKQHQAELYVENEQLEEGIAVYERMLELNPGDNQGMRYPLLGLYLATDRDEAAERLMAAYPDKQDVTAMWQWARTMPAWRQ